MIFEGNIKPLTCYSIGEITLFFIANFQHTVINLLVVFFPTDCYHIRCGVSYSSNIIIEDLSFISLKRREVIICEYPAKLLIVGHLSALRNGPSDLFCKAFAPAISSFITRIHMDAIQGVSSLGRPIKQTFLSTWLYSWSGKDMLHFNFLS